MNMTIKWNENFNIIYLETMIIDPGQEVKIGWLLF